MIYIKIREGNEITGWEEAGWLQSYLTITLSCVTHIGSYKKIMNGVASVITNISNYLT